MIQVQNLNHLKELASNGGADFVTKNGILRFTRNISYYAIEDEFLIQSFVDNSEETIKGNDLHKHSILGPAIENKNLYHEY